MNTWISPKRAAYFILCILVGSIIFHVFVLAGFIPAGIVWGGRAEDLHRLQQLESVSIALNALMALAVLGYTGTLGFRFRARVLRPCFWAMFVLFALNTVGNLLAKSSTETTIFTPITALLALLCLRVLLGGFAEETKIQNSKVKNPSRAHLSAGPANGGVGRF
ncbi:hypothetical protein [Flaviaesturariibacter amylovorans]|uniref:DUF4293 family protein n=1 Tax=Flaviaesturariibacter amylovorans TaxID=1084520 RepID=A0ABP8HST6_9BACT